MLQCVAVCRSGYTHLREVMYGSKSGFVMKLCIAVHRSASQCVAVCCSVLQCVAVCCSALQCVAVCCSALQCVAVCHSVLQCVYTPERGHAR